MTFPIVIEAVSVGILVVVLGVIFHFLSLKLYGDHDLNNMYMFAIHLFFIGIITHLVCEYSGLNKWYCKNGIACRGSY